MFSTMSELAAKQPGSLKCAETALPFEAPDVLSLMHCERCCTQMLSSDTEDAILSQLAWFGLGAASGPLVASLRKEG
jgi:hypothetical protein